MAPHQELRILRHLTSLLDQAGQLLHRSGLVDLQYRSRLRISAVDDCDCEAVVVGQVGLLAGVGGGLGRSVRERRLRRWLLGDGVSRNVVGQSADGFEDRGRGDG